MKIYTKTGDKGETSLYGGKRLSKSDIQIESYGTVDELNSYIGLLVSMPCTSQQKKNLLIVQERLFTIGAHLSADPSKTNLKIPPLFGSDIELLEKEIDMMDIELPQMTAFILPSGNQQVSFCHIARTICRRAERNVISLAQQMEVNILVIKYLNRLSDYLFTLSRWVALKTNAEEIKWIPKFN